MIKFVRAIGRVLFCILVVTTFAAGCAETKQYTIGLPDTTYELPGIPANIVDVRVNDLRPEKEAADGLKDILKGQVVTALSSREVEQSPDHYTLIIDIIEHRPFLKRDDDWIATTWFRIKLLDRRGNSFEEWQAMGLAQSSRLWGLVKAESVSQDSYEMALSYMMSSLSQVTIR
ncbi:MAG: hypothetical protein JRC86_01015 [Deltaproteobacteria bacterium]|nr:hypothetical protein [Deltaproteobacteria bacterium]